MLTLSGGWRRPMSVAGVSCGHIILRGTIYCPAPSAVLALEQTAWDLRDALGNMGQSQNACNKLHTASAQVDNCYWRCRPQSVSSKPCMAASLNIHLVLKGWCSSLSISASVVLPCAVQARGGGCTEVPSRRGSPP